MILQHQHLNAPRGARGVKFASVDSGLVGISTFGRTPMWSTGFAGCIGLVMCGAGSWGALVHLNQTIQDPGKDLELALDLSARFVCSKMNIDRVTDVLIFYGDAGHNQGQRNNLSEQEIRRLLRCERVIDLRRGDDEAPYGGDFMFVPADATVYTGGGLALSAAGFDEDDALPAPPRSPFPYRSDAEKQRLTPGLGHKGWFQVP
jgi:hypothetical protein